MDVLARAGWIWAVVFGLLVAMAAYILIAYHR